MDGPKSIMETKAQKMSCWSDLIQRGENTSVTIWQKIRLIARGEVTVSEGENNSFLIFRVHGTLS